MALYPTLLGRQSLSALPALGAGSLAVIDAEVRKAVQHGSARVLVEVRLPNGMTPEEALPTSEAVAAQRRAIADAQASVLSRLSGTHSPLLRQYETVPLLLLEIHDDALTTLEQMGDVVARVRLDSPTAPTAPGLPR